ncbi:alpha/beta hydrolase [Shewanella sp. 5_MG-2023]|uniref:alpha/beta hydrolase n=1 Tax=Shewanella sp. 5_MG-2023 TaxID=3062656 RepID=UPI0026E3CEEB|nr:alpha/beta hydrolase [Shewanella sp. 5_MG-2023]MDO6641444.1 alpha/beta hydrolase [Shewanella sp. 5_MG-2023]
MAALRLLAGKTAFEQIEQNGIQQSMFTQLFAASGGPKWIGVAGLDKYLFSEFFSDRQAPLYTMGASSGAWRLSCLAQKNPLEAYHRFEGYYIDQRYETVPSRQEVTEQVERIIAGILGANGAMDIVNNRIIQSHFVVCKAKHLNAGRSKGKLAMGLAATAVSNAVSRRSLAWHFERLVFSHQQVKSPFSQLSDLPTEHAQLTRSNINQVLLATGSIPLLLSPVTQINGVSDGHYYDGGITDYHFDMPLPAAEGLSLYPHFYPYMSPGWFDKSLKWRRAKKHYHNALILAPTPEFIASLPYQKIPDREDFKKLDSDSRIAYWRESVKRSEQLAIEFAGIIENQSVMSHLERL